MSPEDVNIIKDSMAAFQKLSEDKHDSVLGRRTSNCGSSKAGSSASAISYIGGRHMQNDARLGINWSHEVSAKMRAEAQARSASKNGSSANASVKSVAQAAPERDMKLKRDPAGGLREPTNKEKMKEAEKEAKRKHKEEAKETRNKKNNKKSPLLSWIW